MIRHHSWMWSIHGEQSTKSYIWRKQIGDNRLKKANLTKKNFCFFLLLSFKIFFDEYFFVICLSWAELAGKRCYGNVICRGVWFDAVGPSLYEADTRFYPWAHWHHGHEGKKKLKKLRVCSSCTIMRKHCGKKRKKSPSVIQFYITTRWREHLYWQTCWITICDLTQDQTLSVFTSC